MYLFDQRRLTRLPFAIVVAASIAGCGSGSGSSDASDTIVGRWMTVCDPAPTGPGFPAQWLRTYYDFGASGFLGTLSEIYSDSACSTVIGGESPSLIAHSYEDLGPDPTISEADRRSLRISWRNLLSGQSGAIETRYVLASGMRLCTGQTVRLGVWHLVLDSSAPMEIDYADCLQR